jgi:hypothetical protein
VSLLRGGQFYYDAPQEAPSPGQPATTQTSL